MKTGLILLMALALIGCATTEYVRTSPTEDGTQETVSLRVTGKVTFDRLEASKGTTDPLKIIIDSYNHDADTATVQTSAGVLGLIGILLGRP